MNKKTSSQRRMMKKGFVFSLDMAMAVFAIILLLVAAHKHIAASEKNSISNAQMMSVGSDIVAALDHEDVLQTMNEDIIESRMTSLLPQNYDMMLKMTTDDGTIIYAGSTTPGNQFVAAGKRFFTIKEGSSIENYAYVNYWIWAR